VSFSDFGNFPKVISGFNQHLRFLPFLLCSVGILKNRSFFDAFLSVGCLLPEKLNLKRTSGILPVD
jgi:hypothetical protein